MNEKIMQQMMLINEIMRLALLVNNATEHNVFIEYPGHVNCLNCRIAKNGWKDDMDDSMWIGFHARLNLDKGNEVLKAIKDSLVNLYMDKVEKILVEEGA